mmetsp:Transcript_12541/g.26789  ORF Transcript_12541/g.26789 Transcript_12541/m.26789 type:complete len:111 (-) Transcript_12541:2000-2332(-)
MLQPKDFRRGGAGWAMVAAYRMGRHGTRINSSLSERGKLSGRMMLVTAVMAVAGASVWALEAFVRVCGGGACCGGGGCEWSFAWSRQTWLRLSLLPPASSSASSAFLHKS